jgi:hypothetical protein
LLQQLLLPFHPHQPAVHSAAGGWALLLVLLLQ